MLITNAEQIVPGAKIRRAVRDRALVVGGTKEHVVSHLEKPQSGGVMIVFEDKHELPLREAKSGGWEIAVPLQVFHDG
ncbi:MAG: hypothetical protein GY784_14830 [Gammaproteobacteria bacterium]|nr:hypothetical protein [Gammaproteobacteria bacterium]